MPCIFVPVVSLTFNVLHVHPSAHVRKKVDMIPADLDNEITDSSAKMTHYQNQVRLNECETILNAYLSSVIFIVLCARLAFTVRSFSNGAMTPVYSGTGPEQDSG